MHTLTLREAVIDDIPSLQSIRLSVNENVLSNPALVKQSDYVRYITTHGKGWLCEMQNEIVGFAIIDTEQNNIWALFIKPGFEKKGIGKNLHDTMLVWHFSQSINALWLSTDPDTRAETFYRKAGWKETGKLKNGEIKFEMTYSDWKKKNI